MAVGNPFSTVRKILYAQALTAIVITLGFVFVDGWRSGLSPLVGAMIAIFPSFYFAYKIYLTRYSSAQVIVKAFYSGETVKLFLTAALFWLALQIPAINFLTLLAGYIAVLSVFWFALYYLRD